MDVHVDERGRARSWNQGRPSHPHVHRTVLETADGKPWEEKRSVRQAQARCVARPPFRHPTTEDVRIGALRRRLKRTRLAIMPFGFFARSKNPTPVALPLFDIACSCGGESSRAPINRVALPSQPRPIAHLPRDCAKFGMQAPLVGTSSLSTVDLPLHEQVKVVVRVGSTRVEP